MFEFSTLKCLYFDTHIISFYNFLCCVFLCSFQIILAASVQDLPLLREVASQSWAQSTFLYLNTKYMLKMYLNTKYVLKIYLNTKYFLQMYLNTKYIDVFKYFFLYYFQNIVLIH